MLAYQCVQFLRAKLKAAGMSDSGATLRETLSVQRRVATTFRQHDGRTQHVRKATGADETELMAMYRALGVNPEPGGTLRLVA